MSSQIGFVGLSVTKKEISDFLTDKKMSEIATQNGYNIEGDFLPNEFRHLVVRTTTVVLKEIRKIQDSEECDKELEIKISRIVKGKLEKVCHIPENNLLPETDFPVVWRDCLIL